MKKIYYILIVAIFAVVSCVKEQPAEEITESEQVSVVGLIQTPEDFITKTDYDTSSGTQAIFSWKGEEKISLMKQTGLNTNLTHELYSGTATDGSPEMTFKGASLDYDTGYALYPARDATTYGNARFDWYSDYANKRLYLWMGESLTYNSGAPLSNIVPMVGKLTGGEYVFNVVSGILDVQIKHMPSTANKVRIESNSHNLSLVGFRNSTSNIGMVDELEAIYTGGLKLDQNNASAIDTEVKTKTYSFTAGLDYNTTYHFYFPIPAGALNNGTTDTFTIKILQDNTLLCEKTTSSAITITNGHITPLRPLVPGATVSISGSSNDPKLNYTRDLGNDAVLHVHISNSETEITNPQSVYRPTNRYSNTSESQSLNGLLDQNGNEKLLTTSGKYYLHYYVDKSASNNISDLPTSLSKVITHGVVPFYFLSATDKNAYTGQYQMTYTSGSTTLTLQTSDDASKGNIMLTEFAGLTGKLYTTYPHETDAFTDANLVFAGTWEIASLGGHYIYSADNADGSNFKNAIWLNLGADTSADANFDNKNWTLTSESHYLIDEGNTLVSYAFLRGNVSRDTYTVVGNESVFHSNWDVNDSDNNLRYDPSIDQYSKDFTVPGDVSSFEFKIVKNHAYANGEWPASNNYVVNDITANGYSKTLTIVFNPNTNSITHSFNFRK